MLNFTKRKYIEAAYRILCTHGIKEFSIRNVAKEVGCTSATLYRHFDNVDHLLTLASIRVLKDYADDVRALSRLQLDPLSMTLRMWECFAQYAFANIPVFERLYFSGKSEQLREYVSEYYKEFPDELDDIDEELLEVIRSSDMDEREFIMLKQAVENKQITMESAEMLRKVDIYLFRGMLHKYREVSMDDSFPRRAAAEFIRMLQQLFETQRIDKPCCESESHNCSS